MNVEKNFNCKIKIGTGPMVSGNDLFCLVYIEDVIIGELYIDYSADKVFSVFDMSYEQDFKDDEKALKESSLYELIFNEKFISFLENKLNKKEKILKGNYTKTERLVLKIFFDCIEKMMEKR